MCFWNGRESGLDLTPKPPSPGLAFTVLEGDIQAAKKGKVSVVLPAVMPMDHHGNRGQDSALEVHYWYLNHGCHKQVSKWTYSSLSRREILLGPVNLAYYLWLVPSEIMDLRGTSTTAAFPNQHNFNCILNTYPYVHRKAYQRSFIWNRWSSLQKSMIDQNVETHWCEVLSPSWYIHTANPTPMAQGN